MAFRSIFGFDGGSNWARDWSQYDFAAHRPGLGAFSAGSTTIIRCATPWRRG